MFFDLNFSFIIFLAFSLFYVLFLLIWHYKLLKEVLTKPKNTKERPIEDGISIIVAARNEAKNLIELIPQLFSQDYPKFEVIVVDDCSYDNTTDVLLALKAKFETFKTIKVEESNTFSGGKKFAITLGIKGASYENLVFIDADCKPSSNNWLKTIANKFSEGNDVIIGFGGYQQEKSFLNFLIRTDTNINAVDFLSATSLGIPYMAVGRNFAYKKSLFFKHKGFAKHMHLKSGDDDLFLNQVASSCKVGYLFTEGANTFSIPKKSFAAWFTQKNRHVSTFKKYPISKKILVFFLWWLKFSFYAIFIVTMVLNFDKLIIIIGIFLFLILIRLLILTPIMKRLEDGKLHFGIIVFEPILIFFQLFFPLVSMIKREVEWKSNI